MLGQLVEGDDTIQQLSIELEVGLGWVSKDRYIHRYIDRYIDRYVKGFNLYHLQWNNLVDSLQNHLDASHDYQIVAVHSQLLGAFLQSCRHDQTK